MLPSMDQFNIIDKHKGMCCAWEKNLAYLLRYFMGCIVLVRCVLVLRCGLAGVVWYPDAGFSLHPEQYNP